MDDSPRSCAAIISSVRFISCSAAVFEGSIACAFWNSRQRQLQIARLQGLFALLQVELPARDAPARRGVCIRRWSGRSGGRVRNEPAPYRNPAVPRPFGPLRSLHCPWGSRPDSRAAITKSDKYSATTQKRSSTVGAIPYESSTRPGMRQGIPQCAVTRMNNRSSSADLR